MLLLSYAVSSIDHHDTALTVRSLLMGTVMAGLGAALGQIYIFKPIVITVSPVFLLLLIYAIGKTWEHAIPVPHRWLDDPSTVKRRTAKILKLLNPGPFGLKEVHLYTRIRSLLSASSSMQ